MTHKEVANSVSNFEGILFTRIGYTEEVGMLQDPRRSEFLYGARIDPLHLLNPSKYPDLYVNK